MKRINLRTQPIIAVIIITLSLFTIANTQAELEEKNKVLEEFGIDVTGTTGMSEYDPSNILAPEYAPGQLIVKLKEGSSLEDIKDLNAQYNVTQSEKVFKDTPDPQETLTQLKDKLAKLSQEHESWYWQLDKDSQEYKDYIAKIEKEKEVLTNQIQAQETLIAQLEQRQKRAPEGATASNLENVYLLNTNQDTDILAMTEEYSTNSNVEYAQPNYLNEIYMLPNDPYYSSSNSWDQGYDDLWGLKKIEADKAWDISQGEGVVVAVVDTGLDYNHEDIQGNVWINQGEIPSNGIDDDNNGYVDDYRGYDFANNDNDPKDDQGHGTHVAGTIAAVGNNNIGIIGIAPKTKIMALKTFRSDGKDISETVFINALKYAADMGAEVISNSWGPNSPTPSRPLLEEAIDYAYAKGCVVVFAAGNANADIAYYSPANYSKVIAVAATSEEDIKCDFSNYGTAIDVTAPGGGLGWLDLNILSLLAADSFNSNTTGLASYRVGSNYFRTAGTSMACPHVSGLAALVVSQHPDWSQSQIVSQIKGSADHIDLINPNFTGQLGTGRINVTRALGPAQPNIGMVGYVIDDSTGNNNGVADPGESVDLIISLKNNWLDAENVYVTLSSSSPSIINITGQNVNFGNLARDETKDNSSSPFSFSVTPNSWENIEIMLTATIVGNNNYVKTIPFPIVISDPAIKELAPWPKMTYGEIDGYSHTLIADIDGDLRDDIILVTQGRQNTSERFLEAFDFRGNKLSGNWPISLGSVLPWYPIRPAVADILPDSPGNEIVVLFSYGDYENSPCSVRLFRSEGSEVIDSQQWPRKLSSGFGMSNGFPVIADLDQNGNLEIIVITQGYINVLGSGGSQLSGWPISIPITTYCALSVGDMDSDSQLEVIIVDDSGYLHVYNHDGTEISVFKNYYGMAYGSILADIDSDSKDEIIAEFNGTDVFGIDNNGGIIFQFITPGTETEGLIPAVADLDRDGSPEIIVSSLGQDTGSGIPPGMLYVLDSSGNILPGWPWEIPYPLVFVDSVIGDVDSDGDQEIVVTPLLLGGALAFHHDDNDSDGLADLVDNWPVKAPDTTLGIILDVPALSDLNKDGNMELVMPVLMGSLHVYACKTNASENTPSIAEWPMFRGNAQHTGRYMPQDITCPTIPIVTDEGQYATSTTQLSASWSSSDSESGVVEYQYAIGTSQGTTDVVGWTSIGTTTSVTKTGLALTNGTTYYFSIKAKNGAGLWSEAGYSDGITVDTTSPSGTVLINNNASYTNSTTVTLTLSATDTGGSGLSQMQFSNDNLTYSAPKAYATTESWTLTSGDGIKTVYVKFKDVAGNCSVPYSDSITLSLPDLTISSIYNDNRKLSIRMGNIGKGEAPKGLGHLYIWIDGVLKWTYSLGILSDQSFRSPGGSTVVQPQILSGQHTILAKIDPNNAIEEGSETNNSLQKGLNFDPDLGIYGYLKIGKNKKEVRWNQTITLTPADVDVISGTQPAFNLYYAYREFNGTQASGFRNAILFNTQLVSQQTNLSLFPQQIKYVTTQACLKPQNGQLQIKIDADNTVKEASEANNNFAVYINFSGF